MSSVLYLNKFADLLNSLRSLSGCGVPSILHVGKIFVRPMIIVDGITAGLLIMTLKSGK